MDQPFITYRCLLLFLGILFFPPWKIDCRLADARINWMERDLPLCRVGIPLEPSCVDVSLILFGLILCYILIYIEICLSFASAKTEILPICYADGCWPHMMWWYWFIGRVWLPSGAWWSLNPSRCWLSVSISISTRSFSEGPEPIYLHIRFCRSPGLIKFHSIGMVKRLISSGYGNL